MAAQLAGGAVLSAFLQVAFDRLATREVIGFARQWEIDLVEVENLKKTSTIIQALTDDAEVKQFTNPVVKLWLNHLKQLLYEADDILDEYVTDILRAKLESESEIHPDRQVRNSVSLTTPSSLSESSTSVLSSLSSGIESAVGFFNQTLDEIQSIPHKVHDIYEELRGIKEYSSKVKEINDKLKGVAKEGSGLGLSLGITDGTSRSRVFSQRPPTSSLVTKDKVCGREKDKEEIIEFLLRDEHAPSDDNNRNFSVLPIVGMGGLGKTTLAQLVYADGLIMNHFHLKAWVCVSEEFDIVRITREILESVTGRKPESDILNRLQNQLQVVLNKKKFFLVLDDVWNLNYNKWDGLQTPFAAGARGSKILVTTRDHRVSSMLRSVTPHLLKPLSDEACINLLNKHAFVDGHSPVDAGRKLEMFGREVVEKCKGLPLAVKTIAGLLRDRMEDGEWKAVLENEIWDLEDDESEILPSLMLSYHHLPPHLKRCFAYCALFPKDYEFDKIKLVRLWMAEGIVHPKGTKRLEDIGVGYFDDLFMRSFFDQSNRPISDEPELSWIQSVVFSSGDDSQEHGARYSSALDSAANENMYSESSRCLAIKSFSELSNVSGSSLFVMHDLIHDFAQFVSAEIYFGRERNKPSKIPATTRHLSYDIDQHHDDLVANFRDIKEIKGLRTLLKYEEKRYVDSFHKAFFQIPTTHQFLRVLCLSGCLCQNLLPDSIGTLKHLRLLDLSYSDIMLLPDSITNLYNLQTLILTGCYMLSELPKDMGDLVNLRHLFLPDSWKQKMPLRMGCLSNLQTLNEFSVGLHARIGELRDLSQLRGRLQISNLEKVGNNGTEAVEADLMNKPHLRELRLYWSDYGSKDSFPDSQDEKVDETVLDLLQPCTNLEMLSIDNYGGTRFPIWVGHYSFSNLVAVVLRGCHKCTFLPSLGQLPSLKYLKINNCSALNIAGSELGGGDDDLSVFNKQFRSLETLMIYGMIDWEVVGAAAGC